jgi:hypothetical protein
MRRAPRQKMNAEEYDWTDRACHTRRRSRMTRRPARGKAVKRALARRRRRHEDFDDFNGED